MVLELIPCEKEYTKRKRCEGVLIHLTEDVPHQRQLYYGTGYRETSAVVGLAKLFHSWGRR